MSSNGFTISIAMCTYNGARFLMEQLESFTSQERLPDELVICDDGSSDDSITLIQSFAARAPFPVHLFQNDENLGSTRNFEKAMSLCKGDLIALSDQDDRWDTTKLRVLAEFMFAHPDVGGVFTDGLLMDESSKPAGRKIWESIDFGTTRKASVARGDAIRVLLKANIVTGATLMLRSSELPLIAPIPQEWVHDGWIAWMLALRSKLAFVDSPLISYRIYPSQQVGLPPRSIRERVRRARSTGASNYIKEARTFEILLEYLERNPSGKISFLQLREKIDHFYFRARLPENRLRRFFAVVSRWRWYRDYSQGWKSMMKDLI